MRLPRPRFPLARRRTTAAAAEPPSGAPAVDAGAAAKPPAPTVPGAPHGGPGSRPDPHERIDGLRAWVAQIDRRLGVRSYAGAAVAVLALAAGVVALVLALSVQQDAATNDDVQSLRDQLSGVEQSASQAAEKSVQSLNQRLGDLEDEVNRLSTNQSTSRRELQVVQDDIKDLRSQISQAGGATSGGAAKP